MDLLTRLMQFDKQGPPPQALLAYLDKPNGTGVDTGKYILPDATTGNALAVAIRAATGWVSGTANLFYAAAGASGALSSAEILVWSGINQYHILFSATKGLAIYDPYTVTDATIVKADKWMKLPLYDDTPTAIFNGADMADASSYVGGPVLYRDADGDYHFSAVNTPGVSGLDDAGNAVVDSTSQRTRTATDGTFTIFTPGTTFKRYISDDPTLLPGLVTAPPRTNLCTPMKVNPTVTTGLSISSGTATVSVATGKQALIEEAGLQNICTLGSLYKVEATTDSVIDISGTPGVDTTCSGSIYVAVEAGSAALRMAGANRVTTTDPKLVRLVHNNQAVIASNPLALFVAAGSTVYFIGFQYEVGTFGTNLIVNTNDATGQVTRSNTVIKFPTSGKIRPNDMAFRTIVLVSSAGQVGTSPFGIYYDSSNRVRLLINQTNVQFAVSTLSLSSIYMSFSHTHAVGDCIDCVCIKTINGATLAARVYRNGAWGAWTTSTTNTTEAAKGDMSIPSEYTLGSVGPGGYLSGEVKLFDTLLIPYYAVADPLAWAMAQWRLQ